MRVGKDTTRRIKYIFLICAVWLVFANLVGCSSAENEKRLFGFQEDSAGELRTLDMSPDYREVNVEISSNACITEYEDGQILATDYQNLYVLRLEDHAVSDSIEPPEGYDTWSGIATENNVWNPTGVYYNKNNRLIYIANYNGHNILIGKINSENRFEVIRSIENTSMVSPENIMVSADGNKIVVADYDGNKVLMFDQKGNLQWENEVNQAHGVTMDESHVYVSSLQERSIIKYTLDGKKVKERGKAGQYGKDRYLWPTAIFSYGDNLLVSDAHQGRIILLDKDLRFQGSIGGNGASIDTFNFPYSVICIGGSIYVADTFNCRILKLNFDGIVQMSFKSSERKIVDEKGLLLQPYSKERYSYNALEGLEAEFFNPYLKKDTVVGSYSSITLFKNKDVDHHIYMSGNPSGVGMPAVEQLYLTYGQKIEYNNRLYYVFGSPQKNYYYYIFDAENRVFFISNYQIMDGSLWAVNDKLYYGGDLNAVFQNLLAPADECIEKFNILVEQGVSRKDAYVEAFCDYYNSCMGLEMDKGTFEKWIEQSFSTASGKSFWNAYSSEDSKDLADVYFKECAGGRWDLLLDEILYVKSFVHE